MQGRFMPPQHTHPSEQGQALGSDGSQRSSNRKSPNETTIYKGLPHKDAATHQEPNLPTNTGIQTSPIAGVGAASLQSAPTKTS